ncbi:hypothetical protein [Streptomyces sp. NP-1717]|uniref:hypothetical protein n=1 Tax=Streptomyces sp. NP-1717 TaxID=2704470 RepID=UPI001F5C169C|nr:hypothetical protein [Streptomyces sp. NP-1717]MCI3223310.1 hypothetical protein [Streptomyces sp. NP-1717]
MRKLIAKLSDGGRLRYTPTQLWYAAARNRTPKGGVAYGCVAAFLVVLTSFILLVVSGASGFDPEVVRPAVVVGMSLLALALLLTVRGSRRAKRTGTVNVPMSLDRFRTSVIDRWTAVHSRPIGLGDEGSVPFPVRPDDGTPRLVLLCPDAAVLACLALNGVHTTHSVALAQSMDQLGNISTGSTGSTGSTDSTGSTRSTGADGAGVVGIVLHDASPAGLAFASAARAALGERAVVAGMLPRTVMDKDNAVRLRKPLARGDLDAIRSSSSALTAAEADWLTRGWWSPLAAVPPVKLLAVVARAVDRAEGLADPDRGHAQRVGFLTWPTAS